MESLATFAPFGAVLDNPVRQSAFKADVITGLFGLDPLVLKDFLAFSLEFAVKRRVPNQICRGTWIVRGHKSQCYFLIAHELTILVYGDNLKLWFQDSTRGATRGCL